MADNDATTASKSYDVGDIIYVVETGKLMIVPIKIVEEVSRKTVDGITKVYIAQVGKDDPKLIEVGKIKGIFFKNINDVTEFMLKNATNSITTMARNAEKLAISVYGASPKNTLSSNECTVELNNDEPETQKKSSDIAEDPDDPKSLVTKATLSDGSVVRVHFPNNLS